MDNESFHEKWDRLGLFDKSLDNIADIIDEQRRDIERLQTNIDVMKRALGFKEDSDDSAMEDIRQPSGGGY